MKRMRRKIILATGGNPLVRLLILFLRKREKIFPMRKSLMCSTGSLEKGSRLTRERQGPSFAEDGKKVSDSRISKG
jgi:hypothetical protein